MRIKKVKWNNHPILGNLELDFSKATGQIYENILFAGENGTGKTSILESISTFLNKGSFEFFEYIEYEVNGQIIKAIQPEKSIDKDYFDIVDATNTRHEMHTNKNNINQSVDENPLNIRYSGCVFSKARADFKTQQIKHTTTRELDKDKYDVDNEDDFTSLKQLIVDVQNQDNEDYYNINNERQSRGENPISTDEFYQTSKIYRFKNAFNTFFDKIKYDRVRDINGEKSILFKKKRQRDSC